MSAAPELPPEVARLLDDVIVAAQHCGEDNLRSAVLFGSAAEGRLRPSSDVNLMLVFGEIRLSALDALRETVSFAHSTIRLNTLFLEESETESAAHAFAVKFSDIRLRHKVLYGKDIFAEIQISREAIIARLRQVVINLTLRLREHYVLQGAQPEQRLRLIIDASGPVRACAAAILSLEGTPVPSPREALLTWVRRSPDRGWEHVAENLSAARQQQLLAPQAALATVDGVLDLLRAMYQRVLEFK